MLVKQSMVDDIVSSSVRNIQIPPPFYQKLKFKPKSSKYLYIGREGHHPARGTSTNMSSEFYGPEWALDDPKSKPGR